MVEMKAQERPAPGRVGAAFQPVGQTQDEHMRDIGDGGIDGVVVNDGINILTPESTVSNTYKFCAWRIKLDASTHVYRSDMADAERAACLGQTTSLDVPFAQHILSARGLYRIGFIGFAPGTNVSVEAFDARAFHRWLSDDELCRIHQNGLQEIARRGIPMTAPRP